MNLFSMFWSEEKGVWSSKRVVSVFIAVIWTLVLAGLEVYMTIKTGSIPAIPTNVATMYWGMITTVLGIQVAGTIVDKKNNEAATK